VSVWRSEIGAHYTCSLGARERLSASNFANCVGILVSSEVNHCKARKVEVNCREFCCRGVGSMEWKVIATVFIAVFIAELGDKTQLATMLFASDKEVSKWAVFIGSSLALVAASGLGVLAGSALSNVVSPKVLSTVAGAGFVVIGLWVLWRG